MVTTAMGFDVYGKNPSGPKGGYFRNNIWWWRPLANYILEVAPWCEKPGVHWHSNDDTGLGARDSRRLAKILQEKLDSGETAAYAVAYTLMLEELPDEVCGYCEGTGRRKKAPEVGPGPYGCNGCGGTYQEQSPLGTAGSGRRPDPFTAYPFSVENVQEFTDFLRECGGFKIG